MDVRDVSHVPSPLVAGVFGRYPSPERRLGAVGCLPVSREDNLTLCGRSSPDSTLLKVAKAGWEPGTYPWRRSHLPEEFWLIQMIERAQWGLCQGSLQASPVPRTRSAHAEQANTSFMEQDVAASR